MTIAADILPSQITEPLSQPLPFAAVCTVALLLFLFGAWWLLAPGPRRRRGFDRARRLLRQGEWERSLIELRKLPALGRLTPVWETRVRNLEAECHRLALRRALDAGEYEAGVQHAEAAAVRHGEDRDAARERVVETMLAEARRVFAGARDPADISATLDLLARVLKLQSPCPEATFWTGLCHLALQDEDSALATLRLAKGQSNRHWIDPPLYLGALALRIGDPREAVRILSEANRIDPHCPLVAWQLGMAIVAAQGDSHVALRALLRAVERLSAIRAKEQRLARAWVDLLPEGQSYVRELARRHGFTCPLMGNDVGVMVRQAQFALGQSQYRLGQFEAAADTFAGLLAETPPTAPLLRSLGMALARLERYDQAYKHLRTALSQDPERPHTAGYLALSGALGKPIQPEDKPRNVAWAIGLLGRYEVHNDPDWADIYSRVFAEARELRMNLSTADVLRLCDVLAEVGAADPAAAAAYDHLARLDSEAVRPAHALLYTRAALQHEFHGKKDLLLFQLALRDRAAAQAFFDARGWDLTDIELGYLHRWSAEHPATFPPEVSLDRQDLLTLAERKEQAGEFDTATITLRLLVRLDPDCLPARDALARLLFRSGDFEESMLHLRHWQEREPTLALPALRLAVLLRQRQDLDGCIRALRHSLEHTGSEHLADRCYFGACLLLQGEEHQIGGPGSAEAESLLEGSLRQDPGRQDALMLLASLRAARNDSEGLARLASDLDRHEAADARLPYLAALAHLANNDPGLALLACRRSMASGSHQLTAECQYLMGLAHFRLGELDEATVCLRVVAQDPDCGSRGHAALLLGRIKFLQGNYTRAAHWWQTVAEDIPEAKVALAQTTYLAGLQCLSQGNPGASLELLRQAQALGCADPELPSVLAHALVAAARLLLNAPTAEEGAIRLDTLMSSS